MLVLTSIKRRGLEPDYYTFTTLLMACGRTGDSEQVSDVMSLMKQYGMIPDEIAFGAAIDAHRRAGNSVKALECLQDMYRNKLEPSASHYNLVIRTLKAEVYVEKMFKMVRRGEIIISLIVIFEMTHLYLALFVCLFVS